MNRKLLFYLDFIPLAIFVISSIFFLSNNDLRQFADAYPYWIAFGLVFLNILCFCFNHRAGVYVSGVIILLGIVGVVAFSRTVEIIKLTIGKLPIFYGQPIFWLYLIIHLTISWRFYRRTRDEDIG